MPKSGTSPHQTGGWWSSISWGSSPNCIVLYLLPSASCLLPFLLTRGLMYAGSKRAVVSLWQVDDEGTSQLMPLFYQAILQGESPTSALRDAQLQLWQQKQWQNPYFWAAFTLQGDWR
ncbi:CHAT domain-containing protein [Tolypothrix sp. NIES-4075]|uniref:CHAT domain-containing protein n=1 Tax=Tolypothrix sp. NIES-4075 TaxID=2005459 RepID=UPI00352C27D9